MDNLTSLIFIFQSWIILGIVLLVLELFDGSNIFFLPLSLSSFLVSGYIFASNKEVLSSSLVFDTWYGLLLLWAILGVVISFLLVRFRKKSSPSDDDVNEY